MGTASQPTEKVPPVAGHPRWKIIIAINLFAGLILWLSYSTNYSLAGTIPDLVFPPAVAGLALLSLMRNEELATASSKWMYRLGCLPSLIGGGLPVVLVLISFIPPFTLGALFAADEIANERLIQTVVSPDRTRVAKVYFRAVGAYAQGSGRIVIRVKPRWFPIVEQDVTAVSPSYASENTQHYLRWKNAKTLEIIGEPRSKAHIDRKVRIGALHFETPMMFTMPIDLLYNLVSSIAESAQDGEL